MNHLEDNIANVYDTSFQLNSGLCADQSQLNELDIDFDAFDDDANPQDDPFATPMPPSKDISFAIEDLSHFPTIPGPLQSTSLPKASASYSRAEPLDKSCMNNPLLHVFKQPISDDFFDIRKRNGNISNGLDLTSKSTARLWKAKGRNITPEEFEAVVQSKLLVTRSTVPTATESNVSTPIVELDPPVAEEEAILPLELKSQPKHPEIVKDAGVTKNKRVKLKPILRNAKPSATTRVMTLTDKTSKPEEQELKEKTEHKDRRRSSGSITSIGGGIMDVLMSYGEKLRNSFGISSNNSKEEEPPLLLEDKQCDAAEDMVQLDTALDIPTAEKKGGLSTKEADLNPSLPVIDGSLLQNREAIVLNSTETAPVRTSKKRLLPLSPGRERKRKCLQDENANVPRPNFHSTDSKKNFPGDGRIEKPISRPRPLGASKATNMAINNRGNDRLKPSQTMGVNRLGRASAIGGRRNGGARSATSSVSGPNSGPLFASDIYRQLAVEKAQKEQSSSTTTTTHFSKPVPPARPTLRPTIPAAFVFRSEERITQRHAETDEKNQGGEEHPAPSDGSVKTQADQIRKKTSNPILPTDAPVLNTLIRAKARERFDAERKEREKILELQRLIRERERAEQEEREYKEARKRTIPRAHEVPEWYKDVNHKRKDPE